MLDQLGRHGGFDLDRAGRPATSTSTATTRSRTSPSRSARRSARRSATRPACAASPAGSTRSTRRSSRSPSTCRAAPSSSGRSSCPRRSRSATRRSTRSWPSTRCTVFATAAGITLHVTLRRGRNVAPHHRGHVQGPGPLPARRRAGRGRGRAVDQGRAVSGGRAAARRRARLRDRQPALGPEGARARRRRRPAHRRPRPHRARPTAWCCPASARSGVAWRRCGEAGLEERRPRRGRRRAGRSSASASACRCSSSGPTRSRRRAGLGVIPGTVRLDPARREAPADAVEPSSTSARPVDPLFAGARRPAVGVLRALAPRRARRRRRRGRHVRLRRPGHRRVPRATTSSPRSSTPRSRARAGLQLLAAFTAVAAGVPARLMDLTRPSTCAAGRPCGCSAATTTQETVYGDDPVAVAPRPSPPPAPAGSTSSTSTPPAPASR